ncbi:hypothetical protein GCM10027355_17350 [Haloplanus salinarum]|uniref:DUF6603 domain-containing protein n=1 Tax=Haloplanus salinarum TaxID=1912324 RepID=UPI003B429819
MSDGDGPGTPGDDAPGVGGDEEGGALERTLTELTEPVTLAAEDPYQREALLVNMGWNPDAVPLDELPAAFESIFSAAEQLLAATEDPPTSLEEFVGLVSTVGDLFRAIETVRESVETLSELTEEDVEQFGADLVSVLVTEYTRNNHPLFEQIAWVLTIYETAAWEGRGVADGTTLRAGGPNAQIAFERLGPLLTEPGPTLKEAYFGETDFAALSVDEAAAGLDELLPRLATLIGTTGIEAWATTNVESTGEGITALDVESDAVPDGAEPVGALSIAVSGSFDTGDDDSENGNGSGDGDSGNGDDSGTLSSRFRLTAVFYFDPTAGEFSTVLEPLGSASYRFPLGSWQLAFQATARIPGLAITPDGVSLEGVDEGELRLSTSAEKQPPPDSEFAYLIGGEDATRLEIGSLGADVSTTLSVPSQSVRMVARAAGASFVIAPSDAGGFLATVLPEEGLATDFDLGVGWGTDKGVFVEGSASLDATLPIHETILDTLTIETIDVAIEVGGESSSVPVELGLTSSLSIGPVDAQVRNVGLSATFSVPQRSDGSLGPLDVDLGFKPPTGIGLAIDTGAVSGGGFLSFDPDAGRYSGALSLQIQEVAVNAVGILKTPLADGREGYSLLILITADFPAVTLPMGFFLNALGGLVGVHRGFRAKRLGEGVRNGRIGSVLFPEDVVANAPEIISDLRTFFPPKPDTHVFGPMAKFSWGIPPIIFIDVGIMVSIPTWKIALLGKITLGLPQGEGAIVDLKFSILGVVDIPEKRIAIDASLYDSKIAMFDVSGDMALRSGWGDNSSFILSIGGFNPRYTPPDSFPELDRMRASLSKGGGSTSVELTAYVATTPNTFQIGAGVTLEAEAGAASVDGELSFDALFRFDPFEFVVDFYAKMQVALKGSTFGIEVDGTLSGPKPWRVRGKVTIEVVFLSVTVNVDVSIGSNPEAQSLPTADVLGDLHQALGRSGNWAAQLPDDRTTLVSVRQPQTEGSAPESAPVLVHPLGTVSVRQTVVPLQTTIEKYGNATPTYDRFAVENFSTTGGELPAPDDATERFAPAKFKQMSDSEKLQSEAFEQLPAGKRIENNQLSFAGRDDGSLASVATLDFETTVIDESDGNYRLAGADLPAGVGDSTLHLDTAAELEKTGAVATADSRTTGSERFAGPDQSVSVADTQYVVVWAEDLALATAVDPNPEGGQSQTAAKDAKAAYLSEHADVDGELRVVATHERDTGDQ